MVLIVCYWKPDGIHDRSGDSPNIKLLYYETLRMETLLSSLDCSIGSLEIQESLNY